VNMPRERPVCPISVVIPVHQKGEHILGTIRSVLNQSMTPLEIIVVDDASTDGGIAKLAALDIPNLRLLRRDQPGPGGYAARNLAIKNARGEWIAFLDADDEWLPNHLETIHHAATSAPASVGCVFCGFDFLEPSGLARRDGYSSLHADRGPTQLSFSQFLDGWVNAGDCPAWTGATAVRRSTLLAAGLFPEHRCRRGGDKDLWLRCVAKGGAIAVSTITARYNRNATNMVTRRETKRVYPCVCQSAIELISGSSRRDAWRLKQLCNREIFAYAFASWREGPIGMELSQGFSASADPAHYFLLLGMSLVSGPSIEPLRTAIRKLRHGWRETSLRSV